MSPLIINISCAKRAELAAVNTLIRSQRINGFIFWFRCAKNTVLKKLKFRKDREEVRSGGNTVQFPQSMRKKSNSSTLYSESEQTWLNVMQMN